MATRWSGVALRELRSIRARLMTTQTRRSLPSAKHKNIACVSMTSFRFATGTNGSTTRRRILFVQIAQPGAKAKDLLAGTKLVSERGFAGRVSDSGEELDGVWTPDGNEIVFVASTNRDAAAYANTNTISSKYPRLVVASRYVSQLAATTSAVLHFGRTEKHSTRAPKLKPITRPTISSDWRSFHGPTLASRRSSRRSSIVRLAVSPSHLTASRSI